MRPKSRTKTRLNNCGFSKKATTKDGLNEIEKCFLSAMRADPQAPQLYDENNAEHWPELRERMRRTAYHEAGHFAARCFTSLELSHIVSLSIIPDEGHIGVMRSKRYLTEAVLKLYPPQLQRPSGILLLLEHLAGYGSEIVMNPSENFESIGSYCEEADCCETGTDYFKAISIAEILAKPHVPANRILKQADRWTLEMLSIPAVWNAVEVMANKLLECAEIKDEEILSIVNDLDVPFVWGFPKWRRRLS